MRLRIGSGLRSSCGLRTARRPGGATSPSRLPSLSRTKACHSARPAGPKTPSVSVKITCGSATTSTPARTQVIDPFLQVRDPEVDHRRPAPLPRAAAGCRPGRRRPAVRTGRSAAAPRSGCRTRWPDPDRRRAGRPGRHRTAGAAVTAATASDSGLPCRGQVRATTDGRPPRRPTIPTAKPSGASMAVRFSQSGRSWDPDANSTMITTMASTPSANMAMPIRTGSRRARAERPRRRCPCRVGVRTGVAVSDGSRPERRWLPRRANRRCCGEPGGSNRLGIGSDRQRLRGRCGIGRPRSTRDRTVRARCQDSAGSASIVPRPDSPHAEVPRQRCALSGGLSRCAGSGPALDGTEQCRGASRLVVRCARNGGTRRRASP